VFGLLNFNNGSGNTCQSARRDITLHISRALHRDGTQFVIMKPWGRLTYGIQKTDHIPMKARHYTSLLLLLSCALLGGVLAANTANAQVRQTRIPNHTSPRYTQDYYESRTTDGYYHSASRGWDGGNYGNCCGGYDSCCNDYSYGYYDHWDYSPRRDYSRPYFPILPLPIPVPFFPGGYGHSRDWSFPTPW
jgi:hypothetical protein